MRCQARPPQPHAGHHPIYARFLARTMALADDRGHAAHRRELLAALTGRVLEIGAGSGLNFPHYPQSATELVATEPEPYLRGLAARTAAAAAIRISVSDASAEALPFPDASFAAVVASLVLCSVDDPGLAPAEARRVLRRGGELRYYEHIRSPRRGFARAQLALDRLGLPRLIGGDHVARPTDLLIRAAGFEVEDERRFAFRPCLLALPMTPHVLGRARLPAEGESR